MSTKGNAESFVEMRGSLTIPDMIVGDSAYEIAVKNGFKGTEEEWLLTLSNGGIQAEKDPTVPAWAKKPNPPTPAEIGAAPAGFGLGEARGKDVSSTDFNTITANGWYCFNYGGANMPDSTLGYSYMFVCGRDGNITQYIFQSNSALYDGCTHKRTMFNGAWGEWEWVNPPMFPGVEYRTTERWQGSPVYTKLINFGLLPNATTKSVAHGISGLSNVIYINGTIGYSTLLGNNAIENLYVDYTSVVIKAKGDASGYASFITLKYTKA